MTPEEDLSIAAASQVLGVSERTTRRWCSAGKLRARKQGRAHFVDPVSVAELKARRAAETRETAPEVADTPPLPTLPTPPILALRPTSGQAEKTFRKSPPTTDQASGRGNESLGQVYCQGQSLRSEVEHLRTTIADLKNTLTIGAVVGVVFLLAGLVLGIASHRRIQQASDRQAFWQQQAQATRNVLEKRLEALEQVPTPVVLPGVVANHDQAATTPAAATGIVPTSSASAKASADRSAGAGTAQTLKPEAAKTTPKAKKPSPRPMGAKKKKSKSRR